MPQDNLCEIACLHEVTKSLPACMAAQEVDTFGLKFMEEDNYEVGAGAVTSHDLDRHWL